MQEIRKLVLKEKPMTVIPKINNVMLRKNYINNKNQHILNANKLNSYMTS